VIYLKRLIKAGNIINLVEELGKELNQICDNLDLDVDVDSTINEVEEYLEEEKVASYKKRNFVRKAGNIQDIEDRIEQIENLIPENNDKKSLIIRSLENLINRIKDTIYDQYGDLVESFDLDISNMNDVLILDGISSIINDVPTVIDEYISEIKNLSKTELEKRIDIYQKYKSKFNGKLDKLAEICLTKPFDEIDKYIRGELGLNWDELSDKIKEKVLLQNSDKVKRIIKDVIKKNVEDPDYSFYYWYDGGHAENISFTINDISDKNKMIDWNCTGYVSEYVESGDNDIIPILMPVGIVSWQTTSLIFPLPKKEGNGYIIDCEGLQSAEDLLNLYNECKYELIQDGVCTKEEIQECIDNYKEIWEEFIDWIKGPAYTPEEYYAEVMYNYDQYINKEIYKYFNKQKYTNDGEILN
jgi:predicted transcriptional regulator